MRGWRRTWDGMAVTSRLTAWLWDERGLLFGVRREHAIDATAAAATALGSRGDRSVSGAPNGSTRDEKPNWLDGIGRGEVVAGSQLAVGPNLGRPARLGRSVREVVVSRRGARAAAEHAVRLGAQELRPAGADPARRRPEPRASQHGRDRGGGDADPELEQLTLDAHVAPARVLSRQPPDQAARLGRKRRTAGPAPAASPTSLKQRPVPAAERLRADRKAGPALGREQPADRSEQGPVDGRVRRPPPAAPEDR
jgi:hypothetical protein